MQRRRFFFSTARIWSSHKRCFFSSQQAKVTVNRRSCISAIPAQVGQTVAENFQHFPVTQSKEEKRIHVTISG